MREAETEVGWLVPHFCGHKHLVRREFSLLPTATTERASSLGKSCLKEVPLPLREFSSKAIRIQELTILILLFPAASSQASQSVPRSLSRPSRIRFTCGK